jgi:O-antigen ligase
MKLENTQQGFQSLLSFFQSIFLLSFANYRHISPSGNYRGYKNTALLLFAICFLALVNLQARGALISVIIGSIYFFATLIAKKEAEQSRSSAIILLLMLLGVGAYVAFEIESIRTFLSSDSIESRIRVIQSSFELFKHSPILGFGLSSYSDLALSHPDITSAYSGYNNISYADNPHNLFVNLIIEGGLIGVTLMAAILFFSYRSTSGTCLFSLSVRTAIIVYVFNSLTTAAIFYPINMLIMFTLLSLLPPKANANEE